MITLLHKYEPGQAGLRKGLESWQAEAKDMLKRGYAMLAFQIVENDHTIVSIFRPLPPGHSSLIGE